MLHSLSSSTRSSLASLSLSLALSLHHMLDSAESKLVAAIFLLYAALGALALTLIRGAPRHGGNVFLGSSSAAKRD